MQVIPSKIKCCLPSIILILLIILPVVVVAEVMCEIRNFSVPVTTPTTDFVLHNNGTVTHTPTGLMWMRCSLGQTWDGTHCIGGASSYTWASALQAAQNTTFAGYSDWRLPNRNELLSIVEDSCFPSINAAIFPSASSWFWSSSPNASNSETAWFVNFVSGHVSASDKISTYWVRLVRTRQ